jgi:hypothetical protein
MKRQFTFLLPLLLGIFFIVGCTATTQQGKIKESALTSGMTKQYIILGKTTQTEILETFGPPDLVTHRKGKDVWTYDKISYEATTTKGGLMLIPIFTGSIVGGGAGGISGSKRTETSKSTMLMIYFDENDVVMDYKLSVSKF